MISARNRGLGARGTKRKKKKECSASPLQPVPSNSAKQKLHRNASWLSAQEYLVLGFFVFRSLFAKRFGSQKIPSCGEFFETPFAQKRPCSLPQGMLWRGPLEKIGKMWLVVEHRRFFPDESRSGKWAPAPEPKAEHSTSMSNRDKRDGGA